MQRGFHKFYWGFLFILLSFRIQGFDILPDFIGYLLFVMGFNALAEQSEYFTKAKTYNWPLLILSIFTIYQQPQEAGVGTTLIGFVVSLISTVLLLVVVYHLLMGVKDMASRVNRYDLMEHAEKNWTFFLVFQIATFVVLLTIVIPPLFLVLALALFVGAIVLIVKLLRFMRVCGEQL
ncbi:hypothetical protein [Gorillibacterium sp. CAU 1737]|uniref:hypothetical protein n=1 Tax=Gorillibacterium sp. CAU 1737 TaxID=3140362 RepID=UPI0032610AE0